MKTDLKPSSKLAPLPAPAQITAPAPLEQVRLLNVTKQLISFELVIDGKKTDCHLAGNQSIRVPRATDLGADVARLRKIGAFSFRPV